MTADELRAKFKATMNALHPFWDYTRRVDGSGIHGDYMDPWLECAWQAFRAAHASRDAEVEALKKRVRNVVRQMKNCASDITKAPSLTGQWVADTINWFVDEIDIDAAMREESK